jgi:predicted GTPase
MPITRQAVVLLLLLWGLPMAVFAGAGAYLLWERGWFTYVWWTMPLCWGAAWLIMRLWRGKMELLPTPDGDVRMHWTDQDRAAWAIVEARSKVVADAKPEQLTDAAFYGTTAQELAVELARHYHPHATDPVGGLTVPEILAACELAAEDLADVADKYLPAGHLLTIDRMRSASKIGDWYKKFRNVYWLAALAVDPVNTPFRYVAAQAGMSPAMSCIQNNLLGWFGLAFTRRVGVYLIELNSGRLRIGAKKWRQRMRDHRITGEDPRPVVPPGAADEPPPCAGTTAPDGTVPVAPPSAERADPSEVRIAVIGQVKSGKSTLVNTLLGQKKAASDVLPLTSGVSRYQCVAPGTPDKLVLLDTVGYADEGPTGDMLAETLEAVKSADLVLLVTSAREPAREPDRQVLAGLREWFHKNQRFQMPPVLGVMTHVDALKPAVEWDPPYDFADPKRPKERNVAAAAGVVREQLGEYLKGVVPICLGEGRLFGVKESLEPAMVHLLPNARAVALVRGLHEEADSVGAAKIVAQLWNIGRTLLGAAVNGRG